MWVTKEQALSEKEFHYGTCTRVVGPKGGVTVKQVKVRANGRCKTWKRQPDRFELPVKYGLYDYSYISNSNSHEFHAASVCPLNQDSIVTGQLEASVEALKGGK